MINVKKIIYFGLFIFLAFVQMNAKEISYELEIINKDPKFKELLEKTVETLPDDIKHNTHFKNNLAFVCKCYGFVKLKTQNLSHNIIRIKKDAFFKGNPTLDKTDKNDDIGLFLFSQKQFLDSLAGHHITNPVLRFFAENCKFFLSTGCGLGAALSLLLCIDAIQKTCLCLNQNYKTMAFCNSTLILPTLHLAHFLYSKSIKFFFTYLQSPKSLTVEQIAHIEEKMKTLFQGETHSKPDISILPGHTFETILIDSLYCPEMFNTTMSLEEFNAKTLEVLYSMCGDLKYEIVK
jgi:hypothetical protein